MDPTAIKVQYDAIVLSDEWQRLSVRRNSPQEEKRYEYLALKMKSLRSRLQRAGSDVITVVPGAAKRMQRSQMMKPIGSNTPKSKTFIPQPGVGLARTGIRTPRYAVKREEGAEEDEFASTPGSILDD